MTPDLLWALMFSFRCETTEVVYYERRVTEVSRHCVSTEVTRYLLKDAADSRAALIPNIPEHSPNDPAISRDSPKKTKVAVAKKKKPTKKKRKKRSRRA